MIRDAAACALLGLGLGFLAVVGFRWRRDRALDRAARRVWDDFGGECGNDADYCRWSGDPTTVGKCYCQEIAWRHAGIALGRKQ